MSTTPAMKEQDIRPAAIFERYLELSRQDADRFFHDKKLFEAAPCPGCGSAAASPAFEKSGFQFVQCDRCGSLFVSPRPPRAALDAFYGDSPSATYWAETFFPASVNARRAQIFVPRVDRILSLMSERRAEPATVMDVGAGYGVFLDEFRKRRPASTCLAVEPGQKLAGMCRAQGFETLEKPVEDAAAWASRADLAVCFEVIEHVYSTAEFAAALARLVRPGGYLLVTSLCVDGFDIQTLWDQSNSVSPPHHLNFMSVSGFEKLFQRAGLEEVEVLTPGRLDVDIVRNAAAADPSVLAGSRFLRKLIASDAKTSGAFQEFLAANRLSSHAWVLARKPKA
jgi:SAM-dependent methyltransferase